MDPKRAISRSKSGSVFCHPSGRAPTELRVGLYDFGDSWEHAIVVAKVLPPEAELAYPICAGGKLQGSPEDCGGISGFYILLEAIRDPAHDQHEEMLEWVGGDFDPQAFSVDDVNQRLAPLQRRQPKG